MRGSGRISRWLLLVKKGWHCARRQVSCISSYKYLIKQSHSPCVLGWDVRVQIATQIHLTKLPLKSVSLQGFKIFQCYVEDISRYPQLDIPVLIRAMLQRVPLPLSKFDSPLRPNLCLFFSRPVQAGAGVRIEVNWQSDFSTFAVKFSSFGPGEIVFWFHWLSPCVLSCFIPGCLTC